MAAGNPSIVVRFAANVRDFLAGTDQVERALTDLESESGDLARSTEQDTDRMERAFRDAGRKIEATADRTGREAGQGFRRSTADAGREAGRETANEFAQNLGESLASGNIEDIGADTAGGLISGFASMGGVWGGVLAGLAIPVTAVFAKIRADAEKTRERVSTIADALRDVSAESERQLAEMNARTFTEDNGVEAAERLAAAFEAAGVTAEEARGYWAGVPQDVAAVEGKMQRLQRRAEKITEDSRTGLMSLQEIVHAQRAGTEKTLDPVQKMAIEWRAVESASRAHLANVKEARRIVDAERGILGTGGYQGSFSTSRPGGGRRE
jgi:hypothetical protein